MNRKRAVITGIGVVAPDAPNVPAFLANLQEGKSGIHFCPEMADAGFDCQVCGRAEQNINLEDPILKYHELHLANDFIQLASTAALEAWYDAGLQVPDPDAAIDYRTGVVIGGIAPGLDTIGLKVAPMVQRKKVRRLGSLIIPNIMPSGASAYLSSIFAAGGYSISVSSACSTGLDSILNGVASIWFGWADRMIVGASESHSIYNLAGFDAMRLMNKQWNHSPASASRPMSQQANGFVPGSGAGVLILESLEMAQARGAKIYGEIVSSFVNCGAQRQGGSMTFPNKEAVIKAIEQNLAYSDYTVDDIDYINGHLSATIADELEVANWQYVLRDRKKPFPFINSTKSLIGHCLGAAGALETVAMVLQLEHNFIHASRNAENLNPAIEALIGRAAVPTQRIDTDEPKLAMKASFGFGDVNSVLMYKKWEE